MHAFRDQHHVLQLILTDFHVASSCWLCSSCRSRPSTSTSRSNRTLLRVYRRPSDQMHGALALRLWIRPITLPNGTSWGVRGFGLIAGGWQQRSLPDSDSKIPNRKAYDHMMHGLQARKDLSNGLHRSDRYRSTTDRLPDDEDDTRSLGRQRNRNLRTDALQLVGCALSI